MRVVIQRVRKASVVIGDKNTASINRGLLIFLGIEVDDTEEDVLWLTKKITSLRIFPDIQGVMNNSVIDINGDILVVSQFTLHAKTKKGNRPSYINAAKPQHAIPLYNSFIEDLSFKIRDRVYSGKFGADMQIELINDGPVTILIDSKNKE
tara:strand:- start:636 stop:1088 length:453 start_codon:yes stop_codon:yes gene_type:complete